MRDDVVDNACRGNSAITVTVNAEWVVIEVDKASLLPLVVVSTLPRRALVGTPRLRVSCSYAIALSLDSRGESSKSRHGVISTCSDCVLSGRLPGQHTCRED